MRQRLLVIAPHPDDAEIAAFGLYADRAATIVTITAGNAGDMNYRAEISDPPEHYRVKGYLRAVDSVTVPWQGGIPPQRTYNLGYFDGRLDAMYDAPDRVFAEVYGSWIGTAGRVPPPRPRYGTFSGSSKTVTKRRQRCSTRPRAEWHSPW